MKLVCPQSDFWLIILQTLQLWRDAPENKNRGKPPRRKKTQAAIASTSTTMAEISDLDDETITETQGRGLQEEAEDGSEDGIPLSQNNSSDSEAEDDSELDDSSDDDEHGTLSMSSLGNIYTNHGEQR